MTHAHALPDPKTLLELEEKFDPEMRFRPYVPPATQIIKWLLITLSCFHYYTAGFGLLRETTHRGVHLAFVLGLIFLVFGFSAHSAGAKAAATACCRRAASPWWTGCWHWSAPPACSTSPTSSTTWPCAWAIRDGWTW